MACITRMRADQMSSDTLTAASRSFVEADP
jgi:hypothetical protein